MYQEIRETLLHVNAIFLFVDNFTNSMNLVVFHMISAISLLYPGIQSLKLLPTCCYLKIFYFVMFLQEYRKGIHQFLTLLIYCSSVKAVQVSFVYIRINILFIKTLFSNESIVIGKDCQFYYQRAVVFSGNQGFLHQ